MCSVIKYEAHHDETKTFPLKPGISSIEREEQQVYNTLQWSYSRMLDYYVLFMAPLPYSGTCYICF